MNQLRCVGPEHAWQWYDGAAPPEGQKCVCGAFTSEGEGLPPMSLGRCNGCGKPLDDHGHDAEGLICPQRAK